MTENCTVPASLDWLYTMSEINRIVNGSHVPFIVFTGGEVIDQAGKHVRLWGQKCDKVFINIMSNYKQYKEHSIHFPISKIQIVHIVNSISKTAILMPVN